MKQTDYIILVIKNEIYFKEKNYDHVVKVEPWKYSDTNQESSYQQIKNYLVECFHPLFSGLHLVKSKFIKPTAIIFIDNTPTFFEYEGLCQFFAHLGFRNIQFKARKFMESYSPEEEIKKYINSDVEFEYIKV